MKRFEMKNLIIATIVTSMSLLLGLMKQPVFAQEAAEEVIYADATFENFSKSYWKFSRFDIEDTEAINNFIKINQCDLYKEYSHNEFEWHGIQNKTQKFLLESKEKFPAYYSFTQPISLGDYDFTKKGFKIAKEHELDNVKKMLVASDKEGKDVCDSRYRIPNYPKTIALELTRPFTLKHIPIDADYAQELISKKMKDFNDLRHNGKTRENFLAARQVYISAKVKLFAHKQGDVRLTDGTPGVAAKMLGVLEKIEVYNDPQLQHLLYEEEFRRKKRKVKKEL